MKISVKWMQTYAGDVKIMPKGGVDELVEKIGAQLGAVEEVVDLGKKYQGIVVAKVVSCEKHPDADKLSLCKIDDGDTLKKVKRDKDGLVQVVCGAPNVHAGMFVAWLPPGTTVPSSYDKDPFVLDAREIRGQVSNGMLASASELAISEDHFGILEITEEAHPGDDFAQLFKLDDYIIDIENKMFTHRPDCFGQLGVAREIAGITHQKFTSSNMYLQPKTTVNSKKGLQLQIKNQVPELVPRFMAQVFENITVQPSPVWMQTYLTRVGVRPINNIVDITNYFMLLTGQPLHAYDADKLPSMSLETRLSKKSEKLKLLNGKEITFEDDTTILITSKNIPVGVGGVMGGADTEVDEKTKNIVLECASFDLYSIRRTSMKYGLFTDAVTRFNKGQSPLQCDRVLAWARGEIMCDSAAIPGNIYDEHTTLKPPKLVRVSVKFVNERLGLELTRSEMKTLLTNVEFEVDLPDNKDELKVTPSFWRTDIEIPEDIVEEIGRLYGYDNLPLELPKRDLTPAQQDASQVFKQRLRETLAKAGANEVLTYSFVHGDLLDKVGQDKTKAFKLSNALSPDLQYYRLSLTPSLLDKVHMNIKAGFDEFALFEINKVHYKGEMDADDPHVPNEDTHAALVVAHNDKSRPEGAAYYHARLYLEQIAPNTVAHLIPLTKFNLKSDEWGQQLAAPYEPSRSAAIVREGQLWGVVGEFKASVTQKLKLPAYAAGFEVHMKAIDGERAIYAPLSHFPKVEQDITLKVATSVSFGEIESVLNYALDDIKPANTQVTLMPLDIYKAKDDDTHKHVTFRLKITSYDKTLRAEEVNTLLNKAAAQATKKLGAERI